MRGLARVFKVGLSLLAPLALGQGCDGGTAVTEEPLAGAGGVSGFGGASGAGGSTSGAGGAAGGTAGTAGAGGAGLLGGQGDACTTLAVCRPGLTCNAAGVCEFSHATAPGGPCKASGECAPGSFCGPTQVCTPSTAAGKADEPCQSDAGCADGLRCSIEGFSATCQAAGQGDLGKTCAGNIDCTAGLGCFQGVCGQAPPGFPPLGGAPGKTETCATESGAPLAWFRVPRGVDDGDFYRLPYPNDIRLKNGKPDLTGHVTPGPGIIGVDVLQRYVDALQQRDGFGSFAPVYLRFNTPVDVESLRKDGVVQLVDITPGAPELGQGLGLGWALLGGRGTYICENWMGIRALSYSLPLPGHTYAAIINAGPLSEKDKTPLQPTDDFKAMVAAAPPADAALTAAYQAYAPLRGYLTEKKIDPSKLLVASVFTVGKLDEPATKLAAAAGAVAPATDKWTRCAAGVTSPCAQADGDRACGPEDPDFDELHALVQLPIYQQGNAPYLNPEDGGAIDTSAASLSPTRTESVCMALTVPKGTMPASGWPVVVYAHGTGGSFRSHINEGVSRLLAKADAPMAVLGIDQVQHGPRRLASTKGPDVLFYNFANPAAALGNPLQGAADQAALGALASSFSLDASASPTGNEVKFDPEAVLFWGHSQGATEGGLVAPYASAFRAFVFSGQGASLADALVSKTKPQNIAAALPYALQDTDGGFPPKLFGDSFNPALGLLQAYIDPADPATHARRLTYAVKDGATPRHVFQVYGQEDSYSPRITQQFFALALGAQLVAPDPTVTAPDDIFGLPSVAPPLTGNISVGEKSFTAAVRQYKPDGYDGHFAAFKNATASADVVRFLTQAAQGKVPEVGAK